MTRAELEALIDAEEDVVRVDASGLELRRLTGTYAHFFDSSFRGADLTGASFYGATFERCDFTGARLAGVEAGSATFRACTFDDADLSGISLNGATFESPRSNACFFGALGDPTIVAVPDVLGRDTMIGPIRIEAELASSTSNAIYTGVTTVALPARVLVTTGPRQKKPIAHINADLHYWVDGLAPMVAAVELAAPSIVRHACIEELPAGVAVGELAPMPERDAIAILTQLAAIVVAGHENRWQMWGLHPRLCFVDEPQESRSRVTGIAGHTMRFIVGMPPLRHGPCLDPYLPIEVWRGDDELVDDVFALCALGYFLVTGASPFAAPTFDQQLAVIASGAYPRLPGPLGHVLARGLVADREARASSADLLAALQAL